jgi:hypothetical protein
MNAQSLALTDFLAKHIPTKQLFERAVFQTEVPKAGELSSYSQVQTSNFVLLYQFVFGVDPR